MGGRHDQAAAGEMLAHQRRQHRLRGGVERRGRLVEQPDRPLHRDQARDRQPPPLPGREIGRRQVGECRRGRRAAQRRRHWPVSAAAEEVASRTRGSPPPTATASARPGGRDNGPARRWSARGRRPRARAGPAIGRTSPAIMRSSEDLPAPLGPVTSSASPAADREAEPGEDLAGRRGRRRDRSADEPHQGIPAAGAAASAGSWPAKTRHFLAIVVDESSIIWNRAKKDPISPIDRALHSATRADVATDDRSRSR